MNDRESFEYSDATLELPSLLKEQLEQSAELDFINEGINTTAKDSMAEQMGLNILNPQPVEMNINSIKDNLILKLKNCLLHDLDEIEEEKSEDVEPTELDKTECSFLLSKNNNSLLGDIAKNRSYSECMEEIDISRHCMRNKSTEIGKKKNKEIYTESFKTYSEDSYCKQSSFKNNDDEGMSQTTKNTNNTDKKIKSQANTEHDFDNSIKIEPVIGTAKDDQIYEDKIERFKKKRKPLCLASTEDNGKLNKFDFTDVRRVNIITNKLPKLDKTPKNMKKDDDQNDVMEVKDTQNNNINHVSENKSREIQQTTDLPSSKMYNIYLMNNKLSQNKFNTLISNKKVKKGGKLSEVKPLSNEGSVKSHTIHSNRILEQRPQKPKIINTQREKRSSLFNNLDRSTKSKHSEYKEGQNNLFYTSNSYTRRSKLYKNQIRSKILDKKSRLKSSSSSSKSLPRLSKKSEVPYGQLNEYGDMQNENIDSSNQQLSTNNKSNKIVGSINSKLKLFFERNQTCVKQKLFTGDKHKDESSSNFQKKMFTTLKPKDDQTRSRSKVYTKKNNRSLQSLESSFIDKASDYLMNIKRNFKTKKSKALDRTTSIFNNSKMGSLALSTSNPKIDFSIHRSQITDKSGLSSQSGQLNDHLKLNKKNCNKKLDAKYNLNRTLQHKSKIFDKAQGMFKKK